VMPIAVSLTFGTGIGSIPVMTNRRPRVVPQRAPSDTGNGGARCRRVSRHSRAGLRAREPVQASGVLQPSSGASALRAMGVQVPLPTHRRAWALALPDRVNLARLSRRPTAQLRQTVPRTQAGNESSESGP
jgi:hypothetical protein